MTSDTEHDIERYAQSAAATVMCCDQLISLPSMNSGDRAALARIRDHSIDQAAMFTVTSSGE